MAALFNNSRFNQSQPAPVAGFLFRVVLWHRRCAEQSLSSAGFNGRQTSHGFRHLISTALNERGYNRDWIERQLAHGDADEIRDVYNRAQYVEQRRKMMQDWADYLDVVMHGADVVPIRRKRAQLGSNR